MKKYLFSFAVLLTVVSAAYSQSLFIDVLSEENINDGLIFKKLHIESVAGPITASTLLVNLSKIDVQPVLAKRRTPNFIESVFSFLTPWIKKVEYSEHFSLEKVSILAEQNRALAGINGTYFAGNGKPLGVLMIDRELVSAPINSRTALLIDDENRAYIDKIMVSSYFVLADGILHKITGTNQHRGEAEAIIYAPIWGEKTGTNNQGMELVVKDGKISEINVSNSKIPSDGYVISISGPAIETLMEKVKVKDPIEVYIKVIPYSSSPHKIIHLISGGPRLLKQEKIYISKYEEKFKPDIAEGRAARTAAGITAQNDLLFVTIDGKNSKNKSIGASLEELSKIMQSLGAIDAMNLDGGSSSTMVINNKVINSPTGGSQRRVSNAILIYPKQ